MSQCVKREKQKKTLLKIVDKLYKKDLEDILVKFFASKSGSKGVLKSRVIAFIETDKKDIDFDKLKKEIKSVYKANPKIKKSPKKAKTSSKKKKKKSANKIESTSERLQEIQDFQKLIDEVAREPVEEESDNQSTDSPQSPLSPNDSSMYSSPPVLKIPNPFGTSNERPQTLNINDNNLLQNPNQQFESTASASVRERINQFEQRLTVGQPFTQPAQSGSTVNTNMPFRPQYTTNPFSNVYSNYNNVNQSQRNGYAFNGEDYRLSIPPPPLTMPSHPVPNQLIRPLTNSFSGSPLNLSINNYFQSPSQNNYIQQNFFQNPMSDVLNPQTLDSLIEQQKFLLSQYPKSFQDDKSSNDSDGPLTTFVFKCLPKFKVIKTLKETKTIGSLTDIGTEVVFDIKPTDLDPDYFNSQMTDDLKSLLEKQSLKVQLRFTYVSDVNSSQQKDSLPEYLCIECNNQRIYTYVSEESEREKCGPFELNDYCNYNQNKVKFFVAKENYTFLLPCIYEISIVRFDTSDSFLSKLKENIFQFMSSESTKQLIRSRSEQVSQDEVISINTGNKLKLICPLSCRRIETPCRSSDCKHIECFDAYSFFKTNESRYEWFCPICQKSAHFDKLRIDGYLSEVLNSTEDNITEIFIKPDASYDVIRKEKELIVIDLDDSIADSDDIEVSVIDADGCIVLD